MRGKIKICRADTGIPADLFQGYFGGTTVTPFDADTQNGGIVGYDITDEPEMEPVVHAYVKELAKVYGQDDRILIWNIWNEAGNSQRMEKSVPLMRKVFGWIREEDVKQPLTADVWEQEQIIPMDG